MKKQVKTILKRSDRGSTPRRKRHRLPGVTSLPHGGDFSIASGCCWWRWGGVEFAVMLTYYFRPREPQAGPSNTDALLTAGKVADFKPSSVTAYPQGKFYLVRLADGGVLALSRQCTHLGCTVPWDEDAGHFACPCHASVFDMTGSVVKSPAPRALDYFPVAIENNVIRVDTGRRIRRGQFRDDQVIYAKSDSK